MTENAIQISIIDAEFRATLARLRAAAVDMTPLMEEIAGHLGAVAERAFDAETDPNTGGHWLELTAKTIKDRQRKGYWPGKMLQRTGELATSLVPEHGSDYAQVTAGAAHARYHQLGTRRIPARPFLGLDDDGVDDIRTAAIDYLARVSAGRAV